MEHMIPKRFYPFCGTGVHERHKCARDAASRSIGFPALARANLVANSSVLPPGIRQIDRREFEASVAAGEILNVIHGICESDVPGQLVCAGIAWATARVSDQTGYVAEMFEWPGIAPAEMEFLVKVQALQLVAADRGIDGSDLEDEWNPNVRAYDIGGKTIDVDGLIADHIVPRAGLWTCAIVGIALLP